MAFDIICKNKAEAEAIKYALFGKIEQSRFRLTRPNMGRSQHDSVEIKVTKRRAVLSVRGVRLREKKDYCGNHAGPCRVFPGFERPHRKGTWLEGADWVGFNDMLNDVLDALGHSDRAGSTACQIRDALGRRRVKYEQADDHGDWVKVGGYYEDWRNKPGSPRSSYPQGTPGVPAWQESA